MRVTVPGPPAVERPSPGSTVVEPAEPPSDAVAAFTELATHCVPRVCDDCHVELDVAGEPLYRFDAVPAAAVAAPGRLRIARRPRGRRVDARVLRDDHLRMAITT